MGKMSLIGGFYTWVRNNKIILKLDKLIISLLALKSGNKNNIKCILSKGADINAKDQYGWTPLHWGE
jgi:ankyrin repeat protein